MNESLCSEWLLLVTMMAVMTMMLLMMFHLGESLLSILRSILSWICLLTILLFLFLLFFFFFLFFQFFFLFFLGFDDKAVEVFGLLSGKVREVWILSLINISIAFSYWASELGVCRVVIVVVVAPEVLLFNIWRMTVVSMMSSFMVS